MKKTNNHEEYEQITMDFGDEIATVELAEEVDKPKRKKTNVKEFAVGAEVTINPEAQHFCDGRGIPDYARKAYIKCLNPDSKTVLIESAPNGKEYGLLFITDVALV